MFFQSAIRIFIQRRLIELLAKYLLQLVRQQIPIEPFFKAFRLPKPHAFQIEPLFRGNAHGKQGFDEQFIRLWRLYLAYCEAGFDEGRINANAAPLSR